MNTYYLLRGKKAVPCEMEEWIKETRGPGSFNSVARTCLPSRNAQVSTVFLGIDHNYGGLGPPLLFETMVFGGTQDGYCARYPTWEDAERGHEEVVQMIGRDDVL